MNSRNAIAALTVTGLCFTGIATAAAQTSSTTATTSTAAAPTTTPAAATTVPAKVASASDEGPVTTTVTVTASPVTVTPAPEGLSSNLVEASSLSEDAALAFAVINGLLVVLGGLIQALTFLMMTVPSFNDTVQNMVRR